MGIGGYEKEHLKFYLYFLEDAMILRYIGGHRGLGGLTPWTPSTPRPKHIGGENV